MPPCVEGSTKSPWGPCEEECGEGEHLAVTASAEAASVTAGACACETESEHSSQNRKEKWLLRRLQLGGHQEGGVLRRVVLGEIECEMSWHFRVRLAGAVLQQPAATDSALETTASPQQSRTTSHSHSAPRRTTHHA